MESLPASPLASPVDCLICLESVEASRTCVAGGHAFCTACLVTYFRVKIAERATIFACCQLGCTSSFDDACLVSVLPAADYAQAVVLQQLAADPDLRQCPTCSAFVKRAGESLELQCASCHTAFCFLHDLAHPNEPCRIRAPLMTQLKTSIWKYRNSKKCGKCKARIEKNGGCDHMTCRCGHEICWMCGGDYVKNGRRGHLRELFPGPRNFKYCCSDTRVWLQRVGAVTVGIPAAVAGACLYVPVACGVVAARKIKAFIDERRNRLSYEEQMLLNAKLACDGYRTAYPSVEACRTCSGEAECVHVFPLETAESTADPFVCVHCGHFQAHRNACAHYFPGGVQPCMFCNARVQTPPVRERPLQLISLSEAQASFSTPRLSVPPLDPAADAALQLPSPSTSEPSTLVDSLPVAVEEEEVAVLSAETVCVSEA
eukprot:m.16018 g.16018  ORF g.16018 m.16018 type:complete len:430 (+) comp27497_c0_seq1:184-1473(+)